MDLCKNLTPVQGIVVPTNNCSALKFCTVETIYSLIYAPKVETTDNYFRYAGYLLGVGGYAKPKTFSFYVRDAHDLPSLLSLRDYLEGALKTSLPLSKLWI